MSFSGRNKEEEEEEEELKGGGRSLNLDRNLNKTYRTTMAANQLASKLYEEADQHEQAPQREWNRAILPE